MALANAVEGSRYVAQSITWQDEDGTKQDLTGATITGKIYETSVSPISVASITGTLTPDADQVTNKGVFTWAYSAADVATPGTYHVQFTATFPGGLADITLVHEWKVHNALA